MVAITLKEFNKISKAKTNYDMCYQMDKFNYRSLPWVHLMIQLSKSDLRVYFLEFLDILKTHIHEN